MFPSDRENLVPLAAQRGRTAVAIVCVTVAAGAVAIVIFLDLRGTVPSVRAFLALAGATVLWMTALILAVRAADNIEQAAIRWSSSRFGLGLSTAAFGAGLGVGIAAVVSDTLPSAGWLQAAKLGSFAAVGLAALQVASIGGLVAAGILPPGSIVSRLRLLRRSQNAA